MNYIIILDYTKGATHIFKYDDQIEIEDFLINNNFNPKQCNWMLSKELILKIDI